MELVINEKITSREICEIAEKPHYDVLRAIRKMEVAWIKVAESNFALGHYIDANGQKRPEYALTKSESLFVATKFNDEARAKLVLRWEKLEMMNAPQLPGTFSEALQLAADQAKKLEIQGRQLEVKDKEIEIEKEKRIIQQMLTEREWDKIDRDDLYRRTR